MANDAIKVQLSGAPARLSAFLENLPEDIGGGEAAFTFTEERNARGAQGEREVVVTINHPRATEVRERLIDVATRWGMTAQPYEMSPEPVAVLAQSHANLIGAIERYLGAVEPAAQRQAIGAMAEQMAEGKRVQREFQGEARPAAGSHPSSRLVAGLRDMIDSGRLSEGDIPDDYTWLVNELAAQPAPDASTPVYVLVQEGGSSHELYVHAWDSREDAEQDRINCTRDGAYRTSPVIEVPRDLADHPEFYAVLEETLLLTQDLSCVDVPDEDDYEHDDEAASAAPGM